MEKFNKMQAPEAFFRRCIFGNRMLLKVSAPAGRQSARGRREAALGLQRSGLRPPALDLKLDVKLQRQF